MGLQPHSPTLSATYVYREQCNLASFTQVLLQYGNYMIRIQPYKYIRNAYRKRRKFRGVKVSWFLNCGLEVKFRGFRGSRFIHQLQPPPEVFVDMVPSDNRIYRK